MSATTLSLEGMERSRTAGQDGRDGQDRTADAAAAWLADPHRRGGPAAAREAGMTASQWTPPRGHADIAPSRYKRIEGDGYLTLDAYWIVPALLRSVAIEGRVLEPAAGRGHIA
jgi:hypothetical protein